MRDERDKCPPALLWIPERSLTPVSSQGCTASGTGAERDVESPQLLPSQVAEMRGRGADMSLGFQSRHIRQQMTQSCVWVIISILHLMLGLSVRASDDTPRNALILHAYHVGYAWTDNIQEGILSVLEEEDGLNLFVEHMDTKRSMSDAYLQRLSDIYAEKYADVDLDVIISSDDNALNFLLARRDELFTGVPIVFCGINNFTDSRIAGHRGITGVVEDNDVRANVELIRTLHPEAQRIAVVYDQTTSGLAILERLEAVEADQDDRVEFVHLTDMTYAELGQAVSELPEDSVVLYMLYLRDSAGQVLTAEETTEVLAENTRVPIYSLFDFSLGHGVVGGRVVSGHSQGRVAADLALRVLGGDGVEDVPIVRESPNEFMFDFDQMRRFGIEIADLPVGSIVLNRELSFYEQHRLWIWGAVLFMALQALIIFSLAVINRVMRRCAMAALSESEERHRTLIQNLPMGLYRSTPEPDGRFLMANPALVHMLGHESEEEFLSIPAADHWVNTQARVAYSERLSQLGELVAEEIQMRRRDGSVVWAAVTAKVVRDECGSVIFDGMFEDITDRKLREEERQRQEERIRRQQSSLLDVATHSAMVSGDLSAATQVITEAVSSTLGIERVSIWLLSDDRQRLECEDLFVRSERVQSPEPSLNVKDSPRYFEALEAGWAIVADDALTDARIGEFTDTYLVPHGITSLLDAPLRMSGQVIGVICAEHVGEARTWSGDEIAFVGSIADQVTNALMSHGRHQAEIRVQAAHDYLQTVIDTAATAIFTVDPEQRITSVNEAFCTVTGFEPDDVLGQHCGVLKGHPCTEVCDLFDPGRTKPLRLRQCSIHSRDGRRLTIIKSAEVLRDASGAITGGVESFADVTELVEARQAAETAASAKSDFLANMSHEIRTPMNGIIGMTGLLLDTELDEEQRQFAETVHMCADSLLVIINDILDFSKIEAGKLDMEVLGFDLQTALDELLDMVAHRAAEKNLELICQLSPEVPTLLRGDPGRLRQVLLNLANNAVKFTEKGEILITADLRGETETHATVEFAVIDTGIGIPKDRLDCLFQSFSQVDASTTRRFGGTGLGLAISKRLVELMGGEIGVESEEGQGSRFHFNLEIEKQRDVKRTQDRLSHVDLTDLLVLVVDDNETNRCHLCTLLSRWGCSPSAVAGGEEALVALRERAASAEPFQVVLSDMQMPGMSGEMLGKAIKADPRIRDVAMVMLTSMGRRGDAARMREIGFLAYLMKPIKQSQLYDCLVTMLGSEAESESDEERALITRHSLAEKSRQRVRILLAEDNVVNQRVALRILSKLGHHADAVANGAEAVAALDSIPYDIVLMDVQMPEMDGLAATAEIRRREDGKRHTPIIAMTAHAMKGDRDRCLESGMDDYLTKPVKPAVLREMISKWLPSQVPQPEDSP
jgi:PAS domain S-box-containing protein